MTLPSGRAVVSAEWALWGKHADDTEYGLLRCSTGGVFSARNLAQAIDRYSPGTLEIRALPQVTVSWLKDPATGWPSHLGLAIHETAGDDDPRVSPVRSRFDAAGREIVYVRYFCIPYPGLADYAVDYQQLYDAFRRQPLPERDHELITAELAAPERQPPTEDGNRFAQNVAAQLLTTRPVCVLGAQDVPFEERLRFLDLVMSWLPYGARSQMSAATWVNSNFTAHKHRLFFASVPRDDPRDSLRMIEDLASARRSSRRKPDIVVEWGQMDTRRVFDPDAVAYLRWEGLERPGIQDTLARDTTCVDLKDKHSIDFMLRQLRLAESEKLTVPDTRMYPGQLLLAEVGDEDRVTEDDLSAPGTTVVVPGRGPEPGPGAFWPGDLGSDRPGRDHPGRGRRPAPWSSRRQQAQSRWPRAQTIVLALLLLLIGGIVAIIYFGLVFHAPAHHYPGPVQQTPGQFPPPPVRDGGRFIPGSGRSPTR